MCKCCIEECANVASPLAVVKRSNPWVERGSKNVQKLHRRSRWSRQVVQSMGRERVEECTACGHSTLCLDFISGRRQSTRFQWLKCPYNVSGEWFMVRGLWSELSVEW